MYIFIRIISYTEKRTNGSFTKYTTQFVNNCNSINN